MFQSLRPNSPLFILYKGDNPRLENGYIVSVSIPRPKYPLTLTFQNLEMVVDIVVKINADTYNYTGLPATADIADTFNNGEAIVVADNKDAVNSEILNLKQKSTEIINSVEHHLKMINTLDKILNDINPEYAEKKQQQLEISDLKEQLLAIKSLIETLRKD